MENASNYFLPTDIVCKILNVCPRTLQNYRTDGKLKYYKISPKKIIYRVDDVVTFLKKSSCSSIRKDMLKRVFVFFSILF